MDLPQTRRNPIPHRPAPASRPSEPGPTPAAEPAGPAQVDQPPGPAWVDPSQAVPSQDQRPYSSRTEGPVGWIEQDDSAPALQQASSRPDQAQDSPTREQATCCTTAGHQQDSSHATQLAGPSPSMPDNAEASCSSAAAASTGSAASRPLADAASEVASSPGIACTPHRAQALSYGQSLHSQMVICDCVLRWVRCRKRVSKA